ncbi:CRISPR-associated protein, Csn1 family (fragment) [Candidatus Terasakiella magnetica]
MSYRFGFDVGTNSIGWAVLELNEARQPVQLTDLGVRLFSDGRDAQTSNSLNDARRLARGARRRRDRFLRRQKAFLNALVESGLMPSDPLARKALEGLDPYMLRRKGLDEALQPHEFGRALFHINQRRGFQSNRKTNPGEDDESGKIRSAASRLEECMKEGGDRTFGEFLARRHANRESVRARLRGDGAKAEYAFYPTRALIVAEFDCLWTSQLRFHADLADEFRDRLRSILATQRPLKPQTVGRCTLVHDDKRTPWAKPEAQRFRILKELANLEVGIIGRPRRRLPAA